MTSLGTPENVRVWQKGQVFVAPLGEPAPTGFTTPSGNWKSVGLLAPDDGAERTRESNQSDIPAWGVDDPIRQTENAIKQTIKVVALETNDVVYKLRYPDATASFSGGKVTITPGQARLSRVSLAYLAEDDDVNSLQFWSAASAVITAEPKDEETGAAMTEITFTKLADQESTVSMELSDDPALFPLSS